MCKAIWTSTGLKPGGQLDRVVGVQCCTPGCGALIKVGEAHDDCPTRTSEEVMPGKR